MATLTSRLSLQQPATTDTPSELRVAITSNATTLDNAMMYGTGTAASRPSASAVANGYVYRANDTGDLSISNGTAWTPLMLSAQSSVGFLQWGVATVSLTCTQTPTAPGVTIVPITSLGGSSFSTQIDTVVANVSAGTYWPTYFSAQPGRFNGDGNNNVRFSVTAANNASPISMTVTWIAIGH